MLKLVFTTQFKKDYKLAVKQLELVLYRTGSHSDLF